MPELIGSPRLSRCGPTDQRQHGQHHGTRKNGHNQLQKQLTIQGFFVKQALTCTKCGALFSIRSNKTHLASSVYNLHLTPSIPESGRGLDRVCVRERKRMDNSWKKPLDTTNPMHCPLFMSTEGAPGRRWLHRSPCGFAAKLPCRRNLHRCRDCDTRNVTDDKKSCVLAGSLAASPLTSIETSWNHIALRRHQRPLEHASDHFAMPAHENREISDACPDAGAG